MQQATEKFIGLNEVKNRVNLSRSAIRRSEIQGDFPRRVYLAENKIVWAESEIDAWIEEKKQNRNTDNEGEE